MTGSRCKIIAGPFCGHETATRSLPFAWIAFHGHDGVRVHTEPCAGRLLYRQDERGDYWFAGYTHRRCEKCDGIEPAGNSKCSLCGGKLVSA